MVHYSWKIELWSRLGALWAPLGAKMAQEWHQEQKMMKNVEFWGGPWGPKWGQNQLKIWFKFDLIFVTISSALFSDLESILAPKTSPKWKVLGSLFQPRCGYARSVILNNPPMVLLYFSILGESIFDLKRYIFQMFFERCFQDVFFSIFGRNWDQID